MVSYITVIILLFQIAKVLSFTLPSSCDKTCIRKEVNDLTSDEWSRFVKGMHVLGSKIVNNQTNESALDEFVRIHIDHQIASHKTATFLPWHRVYLLKLELMLQEIDPFICLPYWDSTKDYKDIRKSKIWLKIGHGDGEETCLSDGDFSDIPHKQTFMKIPHPKDPTKFCSTREKFVHFGSEHPDERNVPTTAELLTTMTESNFDFSKFASPLESYHGYLHNTMGGDMSSYYSPTDVAFLLHHGFMDKIWADYQNYQVHFGQDKAVLYNGLKVGNLQATPQDYMLPYNVRVEQVLDTSKLCVKYAHPTYKQNMKNEEQNNKKESKGDENEYHDYETSSTSSSPTPSETLSTLANATTKQPIQLRIAQDEVFDPYKAIEIEPIPERALEPLPFNMIKKIFHSKDAKTFDDLPPEAKHFSVAGSEISQKLLEIHRQKQLQLKAMASSSSSSSFNSFLNIFFTVCFIVFTFRWFEYD